MTTEVCDPNDGVGKFRNAFLESLQLIAGAGYLQQKEKIHHGSHRHFALSHAHGLDEGFQAHIVDQLMRWFALGKDGKEPCDAAEAS